MQYAHEAFVSLGFTNDMKYNVFRNTACMMHMGNMTKDFVPVGKEEQAEIKDPANAEKVAELLGIDCEWMITYFCKPKLKVGTEWVQKGSTCTQAAASVSGIARAIYERTFRIVVDKCNETLCDPTMKKVTYIGVLDIAGFEIFEEESLFPKATDATFAEKLMTNLLGKWTQFAKPNPRPDPDAHFAVIHYAATVSYDLTGWLEK